MNNGRLDFSDVSPETILPGIAGVDFVSRVIPRIGYDAATVSSAIRDRIQAILQPGLDVVRMGGLVRTTPVGAWDPAGISARGLKINSPQWAGVVSRMQTPRQIVCFVLTLGEAFDRHKNGGALFDTYVLDGFGSELIETAVQMMEQRLVAWAESKSMACSRRFSPGYCDWPLGPGQKALLDFLAPDAIGVKALASGAMLPSKSVSAVMITADAVPLVCPCPFCKNTDCDHRRI